MQEIQKLTPQFDIIRQYNPSFLERLAKNNTNLADIALGKRVLGKEDNDQGQHVVGVDTYLLIAGQFDNNAKAHIEKIRMAIDKKVKRLGRFRFIGGLLTSLSTAVLLGSKGK